MDLASNSIEVYKHCGQVSSVCVCAHACACVCGVLCGGRVLRWYASCILHCTDIAIVHSHCMCTV